jgi:hypothetical protein
LRCRLVSGIEEREVVTEVGGDDEDAEDDDEVEEGEEVEVGDEDG